MDEEIEFVQVLQMPGTRKNKVTFNFLIIFSFWIYYQIYVNVKNFM